MSRHLNCPLLKPVEDIRLWYPCLYKYICKKTGDCPLIKHEIKYAIRYQRNVEVRA